MPNRLAARPWAGLFAPFSPRRLYDLAQAWVNRAVEELDGATRQEWMDRQW